MLSRSGGSRPDAPRRRPAAGATDQAKRPRHGYASLHAGVTARSWAIAALLTTALGSAGCARQRRQDPPRVPAVTPAPTATAHPRLWLRSGDLPALRARATDRNPLWTALIALARSARQEMDAGKLQDPGTNTWVQYPSEMYAQLFAFVALLAPEKAARADYRARARALLMRAIARADHPPREGQPFRDPDFAVDDRSRWWGEAWPLTVDWIYDALSAADKAMIRRVFLRWSAALSDATVTNHNHPRPRGVYNDPALTADTRRRRWAANNYYMAHMRNLGLMALALDASDDPGGELRGKLREATGAWLYVVDALLRRDCRGGLCAEGMQYAPQSLGYTSQLLLALHTAGEADRSKWGRQVLFSANPFWDDLVAIHPHLLSPTPVANGDNRGFLPAWYGDGQRYAAPDMIGLLGPLGIHDARGGAKRRLQAIRWMQLHLAPGGASGLLDRVRRAKTFRDAILYFMLYEPGAPLPRDPRPRLPLLAVAPGIGHIYARTGWRADSRWFRYSLGWQTIDHQHADGNHFAFYRKGEWLTKERTGYGHDDAAASSHHNTVTVRNDPPRHNSPSGYRHKLWRAGSQWIYVSSGDGRIVARSDGPRHLYVLGDATALYNSASEGSTAAVHVSRSLVWLKPDHLVVYDRVVTRTPKVRRFWLQLPAPARIAGSRAVVRTTRGQQLVLSALLPRPARLTGATGRGDAAAGEPMRFRLTTAPREPLTNGRFLHVLEGADGDQRPASTALIRSEAGSFEGARVGAQLVLFPRELGRSPRSLRYAVPAAVTAQLVAGLRKGRRYRVAVARTGRLQRITITEDPTAPTRADSAGVLAWGRGR